MAHINRNFIDKHWLVFIFRGILAAIFGVLLLGGRIKDLPTTISFISVYLISMGIIDSASALYNSTKKKGWINSVADAAIDVVAAIALLFIMNENIIFTVLALAIYTFASGLIDIVHGFRSTTDPTDKFIRIIAGISGAVVAFPIANSGEQDVTVFVKIFAAYAVIVGICSLIYGAHNRAQEIEDNNARKESAKKAAATRKAKKQLKNQRPKKATAKKASKKPNNML